MSLLTAFLALPLVASAWAADPCPQPSVAPAIAVPGIPAVLERVLPASVREPYAEMLRVCAKAQQPLPGFVFHARMAGVDIPNETDPASQRGFVHARLDLGTGELRLPEKDLLPKGPRLFFGGREVSEGDAAVYAHLRPHSYGYDDGHEAGPAELACAQAMARTLAGAALVRGLRIFTNRPDFK